MAFNPVNNSFAGQTTYKAIFLQGANEVCGFLATPTDAVMYVKGQLMAQYTAGPNLGQFVNYLAAGTNGQSVCVGVMADDSLPTTYPVGGLERNIIFGGFKVNDAALVASTPADIPTGMATLNARKILDVSGLNIWYVP